MAAYDSDVGGKITMREKGQYRVSWGDIVPITSIVESQKTWFSVSFSLLPKV